MKNIAITGSFSSGKTFIANCVKQMGYKVFSCDDYIGSLYENHSIQKVIENEIEELDRFNKDSLAKIIFNNKGARKKIEKIIHPIVLDAIKEFEQQNATEGVVFSEVPLLFEVGFDKYFFRSICVFCLEETRKKRAESRFRGKQEGLFEKIKKIQLSQKEKIRKADFSINSQMSQEKIRDSLRNIINGVI